MKIQAELDEMWLSGQPTGKRFDPGTLANLPEPAGRYLRHAIAPGTGLATAVRLRMHGTIRLRGWMPFTAVQVINRNRGTIWSASVRMGGLPVRGYDRLVDGIGEMRWRMLGIIPVMSARGADITRSTIGRVTAESVWLPSMLADEATTWSSTGPDSATAHVRAYDTDSSMDLGLAEHGGLRDLHTLRWGNPGGATFGMADFGGIVEQEGTFDGYTIPTQLRIGWYYRTDRFQTEGEFFRVVIDSAEFR